MTVPAARGSNAPGTTATFATAAHQLAIIILGFCIRRIVGIAVCQCRRVRRTTTTMECISQCGVVAGVDVALVHALLLLLLLLEGVKLRRHKTNQVGGVKHKFRAITQKHFQHHFPRHYQEWCRNIVITTVRDNTKGAEEQQHYHHNHQPTGTEYPEWKAACPCVLSKVVWRRWDSPSSPVSI